MSVCVIFLDDEKSSILCVQSKLIACPLFVFFLKRLSEIVGVVHFQSNYSLCWKKALRNDNRTISYDIAFGTLSMLIIVEYISDPFISFT